MPSQTDSRVILDRNGAEALFGQGDIQLLEHGEIRRLQGCFVSAEDLDGFFATMEKAVSSRQLSF